MNRLKTSVIILILLTAASPAQSVIPQAVNETINLAPKSNKGELQQYWLTFEAAYPEADGSIKSITTDHVAYSQVCLSNTPDRGIEYQLTIDSFTIGTSREPGRPEYGQEIAQQFDGFTVKWLINRRLGSRDGCFDFGVELNDQLHFVEGSELLMHFSFVRLWEQARYTLGNQLTKIGDSASLVLPAPLCYGVPGVIRRHNVTLARQTIELAGVTNHRGRACAVVKIRPSISGVDADLANLPNGTLLATGSLTLGGELLISLDKGQILQAAWTTRTNVSFAKPDGTKGTSNVRNTYLLRQMN